MPLSNAELALELEATVDGWQAFVNSIKTWSVDQVDTVLWEDPLGGPDITTDTLWRIKEDYSALTGSEWAITAEDVLVPTGNMIDQYSALHYSIKAGDSATATAADVVTSGTNASNASASAANALSSENAAAGSQLVAGQSATTADRYATEAEDVVVLTGAGLSTGEYSALHYAAKSEKWAQEAENVPVAVGEFSAYHWERKSLGWANLAESWYNFAASSALESYNWSQHAEDVLVPEGNMTTEYSAYHWAQKAAASGGALNPTPSSDGTDYAFGDGVWTNSPTFVGFTSAVANTVAGPTIQQGAAVAPDATKYGLNLTSDTDFQAILSIRGPALSRKGVVIGDSADNWRAGMWVHNNDDVEYWGPHYASILFDKGVSSSAIRFNTASAEERMRILESGYVGIGTTAPGALFHVYEDAAATAAAARVESATGNATIEVHAGDTNADSASLQLSQGGGTPWTDSCEITQAYDNLYLQSRHATGAMIFQTNSIERMRIAPDGLVGIGETSPEAKLHVRPTDAEGLKVSRLNNSAYMRIEYDDATTPYSSWQWGHFSGGNPFLNTTGGALNWSHTGGLLQIRTSDNNAIALSTNNTEHMRIRSDGRIGIGTTSANGLVHIAAGSVTEPTYGAADQLILQGEVATNIYMNIVSDPANKCGIRFSDTALASGQIQYDHADDSMAFNVAATGEKMRITGSSVGMYADAPNCTGLHIRASDYTEALTANATTYPLAVQRGDHCRIGIFSTDNKEASVQFGSSTATNGNKARITVYNDVATSLPYMQFDINGSEQMRVTGGKVGINYTNPQRALHIVGTGHSGAIMTSGASTDNSITLASANLTYHNAIRSNVSDAANYGLIISTQGSDKFIFQTNAFVMAEQSTAPGTAAGYGYLWVKNTTPSELWFTNDAGTSVKIV